MSNKTPQSQEAAQSSERALLRQLQLFFYKNATHDEWEQLREDTDKLLSGKCPFCCECDLKCWAVIEDGHKCTAIYRKDKCPFCSIHVTDINVGDIPTPSKGQETKELKQKIEAEINDLHEEFKNLPQEDQDKRKSWMAVRCDVLRQVLFWIASLPNSEQGVHECDASKCVEN